MELPKRILDALSQGSVMKENFPMLLHGGIPDTGLMVHSHFLTFFTTLGQSLGYAAITECPITWPSEYTKKVDLRADSVWFDTDSLSPRIVIEFERFEHGDETKLRQKVENLAIIALATPNLELCLLVYWVMSGSTPKAMESVVSVYSDGFRRGGYHLPSSAVPLMIIKCVMRPEEKTSRLVFGEFLRDERNECLGSRRI